jgi:hypothetical protein
MSKKQMTGKPDKLFLPSGSSTKEKLAEALVFTAAKLQSEMDSPPKGFRCLKALVTKKAESNLDSNCVEEWKDLVHSTAMWLPWANGFVGENPSLMAALLDSDMTLDTMKQSSASTASASPSRIELAEGLIRISLKNQCCGCADNQPGLHALKVLVSEDAQKRLDRSQECAMEWACLVAAASKSSTKSPFDRVGLRMSSPPPPAPSSAAEDAAESGAALDFAGDGDGDGDDHRRIDSAARLGLDRLFHHFSEDNYQRLHDLGDDAPTLFVEIMHHCACPALRLLCRQHATILLAAHEHMLLSCHTKGRRRTHFFQCIHIARAKRDLGLDAEPLLTAADQTYQANGFEDTDVLFGEGSGDLAAVDTKEWVLLLMHVYVIDHMNVMLGNRYSHRVLYTILHHLTCSVHHLAPYHPITTGTRPPGGCLRSLLRFVRTRLQHQQRRWHRESSPSTSSRT